MTEQKRIGLAGHVAMISGGLGDIGRAIARELASRGADIALGDILETGRATELLEELRASGRRARYDCVDVADAEAVERWVAETESDLGTPNLIIPNAATVVFETARNITPQQWNRELRVNLDGAFYLAQAGALRMVASQKPGRIVFLGSWVADRPQTAIPAYSVSKAGLRALCRCMAHEFASSGILVNEVAPGNVDAGLSGKFYAEHPERRIQDAQRIPVGLLITSEEVALHVALLCEPENRHITGATLLMDGGLSLISYLG